ncbi:MAG: glycosyltransferase family 1 protein [Chitinophagales bacterium]
MKRKIAVNTRLLLKDKLEGIGYFTHETLRHIVAANPDIDFYFLFDRKHSTEFIYASNVYAVELFPQARHPFLYVWWFEWSVANWLNQHKPDLFLSPDGYCALRAAVPQLAVMHDIAYEHFPQHNKFLQQKYYEFFMPRFAHKAARIATVSEYSKSDIAKYYGIEPQKIDVVYSAVKENFLPLTTVQKQQASDTFAAGKEYFVYAGSVNPRKNVANMLRAFNLFKEETGSDMKLVIAGAKGWQTGEIFSTWETLQHKEDINFTGRLSLEDMQLAIGGAFGSLYVSLFEGFGVPPLEAMACGVPVITSAVSSMPEICGNAALLAQPENVGDIAAKMKMLFNDATLRSNLIAQGLVQHKKYSWKETAELLWKSCEQAMAQ